MDYNGGVDTGLIATLSQKDFPPLLQEIPDAPKQLFVRGALPPPDTFLYIGIVGARAVSPYGRRACMSLISGLAGYPVCVVSGLALGTDAEAHKAALDAGLPTVAVLPSGVGDASIYPASNRGLAARILKEGGAVVSEYGREARAARWTFPARNRIMAGLSRAVLLIEASERSGTLITARLALDYNREILAVPHPIGSESGTGNNRLIRTGATLVRGSEDILEALGLISPGDPREARERELPPDADGDERAVWEAMAEPLTRDELIGRSGLSASRANIALSSLAIRGLIVERLGKVERA